MKVKYLLLIITGLMIGLSACKKDNKGSEQAAIVGQWFVNKLTIQQQTISTGAVTDTTYNSTAFNTYDYFQFNNDGTASVSSSGIFDINGKGTATNGAGDPVYGTNQYKYNISGSELILTSTLLHPTTCCGLDGPATEIITQLDALTLVLRTISINTSYKTITDTYYTKGQ